MTDNTELQRVMRIRRLGRQIAASLPGDLDCEKAFQLQGDGDFTSASTKAHEQACIEQGGASSGAGGGAGELPGTGHTLPTDRPAGA